MEYNKTAEVDKGSVEELPPWGPGAADPDWNMSLLNHLAQIVAMTRMLDVPKFHTPKQASVWFWDHCYFPLPMPSERIREKEAAPYKELSRKILDILAKLPGKKAHVPPLPRRAPVDFVVVTSGDAFTMAQNYYTYRCLFGYLVHSNGYCITPCPDLDASHAAIFLLSNACHSSFTEEQLRAVSLISRYSHGCDLTTGFACHAVHYNGNIHPKKLYDAAPETGACNLVKWLARANCLGPLLTGIIISAQPDQYHDVYTAVLKDTGLIVHQAYIPHPEEAQARGKYFDQKPEVIALFALLDLSKVLYSQFEGKEDIHSMDNPLPLEHVD